MARQERAIEKALLAVELEKLHSLEVITIQGVRYSVKQRAVSCRAGKKVATCVVVAAVHESQQGLLVKTGRNIIFASFVGGPFAEKDHRLFYEARFYDAQGQPFSDDAGSLAFRYYRRNRQNNWLVVRHSSIKGLSTGVYSCIAVSAEDLQRT
ncbi:MAG TPA: hypothetical protein VD907_04440 [Verrucomicrobiae bacterium]|nr:hypothetical protein [Verrucomicrobiae bacterium]